MVVESLGDKAERRAVGSRRYRLLSRGGAYTTEPVAPADNAAGGGDAPGPGPSSVTGVLLDFARRLLLPRGFPATVTSDYLEYQAREDGEELPMLLQVKT